MPAALIFRATCAEIRASPGDGKGYFFNPKKGRLGGFETRGRGAVASRHIEPLIRCQ
jgi:hypothetical protein